jgi:hypothetical protein
MSRSDNPKMTMIMQDANKLLQGVDWLPPFLPRLVCFGLTGGLLFSSLFDKRYYISYDAFQFVSVREMDGSTSNIHLFFSDVPSTREFIGTTLTYCGLTPQNQQNLTHWQRKTN